MSVRSCKSNGRPLHFPQGELRIRNHQLRILCNGRKNSALPHIVKHLRQAATLHERDPHMHTPSNSPPVCPVNHPARRRTFTSHFCSPSTTQHHLTIQTLPINTCMAILTNAPPQACPPPSSRCMHTQHRHIFGLQE